MAWNPTEQIYDLLYVSFIGTSARLLTNFMHNSVSAAYLSPVSFPELFSGLNAFVPNATSNTLGLTNLTSITAEFAAGDPSGFRTAWWTLTFEPDVQLVLDVQSYGEQLFADLLNDNGTQWSLNIQPINSQMINATNSGAGNPAGLEGDNLFRESHKLCFIL